jgi:hypothetical protein
MLITECAMYDAPALFLARETSLVPLPWERSPRPSASSVMDNDIETLASH